MQLTLTFDLCQLELPRGQNREAHTVQVQISDSLFKLKLSMFVCVINKFLLNEILTWTGNVG